MKDPWLETCRSRKSLGLVRVFKLRLEIKGEMYGDF